MSEAEKIKKLLYRGTENSNNSGLIVANDDYVLIKQAGSTGYLDRFSGNGYSPTEWFVFPLFKDLGPDDLNYGNARDNSVFYHEGRLLKEHKKEIQGKFGLVYPKVERKKKPKLEDVWIVFYKKSDYYGDAAYKHCINFGELISIDEKQFKVKDSSNNVRSLSTNMYFLTICNSDNVEDVYNDVVDKIDKLSEASVKLREASKNFRECFKNDIDVL